jgi:hypothetical protein
VLSSGAGTITYTASNALTALPAVPSWAIGLPTGETANSLYGVLPANPSKTFTQSFCATTAIAG